MILLDTHVVLWLLDDSARLGVEARRDITAAPAALVSVVSLWEVAIKSRLGRLSAPEDLPTRIESAGLQWLDLRPSHAWATRSVSGLPHEDPFDRQLVAQAMVEDHVLLTADRVLLGAEVDGLRTQDARR